MADKFCCQNLLNYATQKFEEEIKDMEDNELFAPYMEIAVRTGICGLSTENDIGVQVMSQGLGRLTGWKRFKRTKGEEKIKTLLCEPGLAEKTSDYLLTDWLRSSMLTCKICSYKFIVRHNDDLITESSFLRKMTCPVRDCQGSKAKQHTDLSLEIGAVA
jgi:hypothetical protein